MSVSLSSPCIVREARADDLPQVQELACRTFPLACPSYITPDDIAAHCAAHFTAERFEHYHRNHDFHLTIALSPDDGTLCGYTLLVRGVTYDDSIDPSLLHHPTIGMDKLYVSADYHGSGVAASLANYATSFGGQRGYKSMWVATNSENLRALRFYDKQGFRVVGHRQYVVGHTLNNDVVLEKRLHPSLTI